MIKKSYSQVIEGTGWILDTKIGIQFKHVSAVLLAYSITQLEMRKNTYKNPETALRTFENKNHYLLKRSQIALSRDILFTYA